MLSFLRQIIFSPSWSFIHLQLHASPLHEQGRPHSFILIRRCFVLWILDFFFSFWQQNSLLRPFTVILCTRLSLGLHYLRSLHVYQSQQPRMYCRIKWSRHPRASSTQHRSARAGPQLFSASLPTPGLGSILSMHLVISRFTWKSQWGSTQSEAVFQAYYSQPGTNTEHTSSPQRAWAEMLDKRQNVGRDSQWGGTDGAPWLIMGTKWGHQLWIHSFHPLS